MGMCDEAAVRCFHAGGGLGLIVPKVSNQEKSFILGLRSPVTYISNKNQTATRWLADRCLVFGVEGSYADSLGFPGWSPSV
jgi:hypothetical protein